MMESWKKAVAVICLTLMLVTYYFCCERISLAGFQQMNISIKSNLHILSRKSDMFSTALESCKPQPECIQLPLPLPSINSLMNGTLKPSLKPRTIYLGTIGRFGNVLYQLAALLSLAKTTCSSVKVFSTFDLSNIFEEFPFTQVSHKEFHRMSKGAPNFNLLPMTVEQKFVAYNTIIRTALQQSIQISAIFINFNLSAGCRDHVTSKLRLKSIYITKATSIIKETIRLSGKQNITTVGSIKETIRLSGKQNITTVGNIKETIRLSGKQNITTVGIHVRRGDLAQKNYYDKGYRVPNETYFNKAMLYFRKKYKNVVFIVTTNDRKWVQTHFPRTEYPDVFESSSDSFLVDFALLTKCDYVIQSLGTFGNWAAYFSGRESVYFKNFVVTGRPGIYRHSLPPEWIPM